MGRLSGCRPLIFCLWYTKATLRASDVGSMLRMERMEVGSGRDELRE